MFHHLFKFLCEPLFHVLVSMKKKSSFLHVRSSLRGKDHHRLEANIELVHDEQQTKLTLRWLGRGLLQSTHSQIHSTSLNWQLQSPSCSIIMFQSWSMWSTYFNLVYTHTHIHTHTQPNHITLGAVVQIEIPGKAFSRTNQRLASSKLTYRYFHTSWGMLACSLSYTPGRPILYCHTRKFRLDDLRK